MDSLLAHTGRTTATDTFFEGEEGVLAVFDFDYEEMIRFNTQLSWARFLFAPPAWISVTCCHPCFINQNVEWTARAQHVALTVDGIRYVREQHPTCCGLYCTDSGKTAQTVPYDKITDCDVVEPAGTACCCCVPNVLSTVKVDTASSGAKDGIPRHELELVGLRNPTEFKKAVWSIKRGQPPVLSSQPSHKQLVAAPSQIEMQTSLLAEIRDELQQMNAHMRETN